MSTHFYVQGHLDGFCTVDTVKATAVNTGDKHSPNSLKFNEQNVTCPSAKHSLRISSSSP